jgi:hypothetical protein
MLNAYRKQMFQAYNQARSYFIKNHSALDEVEKHVHALIKDTLVKNLAEFKADYDEASFLNPFWQNYPPLARGRSPRGDQFPWIEVGEHSIGFKLARLLSNTVPIREIGLPSGTDQRFLLQSPQIRKICQVTEHVVLFLDVKSVGPRDDFDHTVLSTYQVSGDGNWKSPAAGVKNSVMTAKGERTKHPFHCALPPLYVLSSGIVAPTVSIFIKPVYEMTSLNKGNQFGFTTGQPLRRLTVVTLPNGLLLTRNPGYLARYPGLFFPGKDDKKKKATKKRTRVDFKLLRQIAAWRVETIQLP